MFRVLGILIVVLILLIVVAGVVNAKVVRPNRIRKHIAELEAENERLDALLDKQLQKDRKESCNRSPARSATTTNRRGSFLCCLVIRRPPRTSASRRKCSPSTGPTRP